MRNSSLSLIRFFRRFFAVFRFLSVVIVCLSPFTLLPTKTSRASAELIFAALPEAIQPSLQLAAAGGKIELKNLRAQVKLESGSSHAGMRSLELKARFLSEVLHGVIVFFICDTFWRLFRNAERGIIFDAQNVTLFQRLGFVMIAGGVMGEATSLWSTYQFSSFVSENGILQGLTLGTPLDYVARSAGELVGCLSEAAIVFILAEVFRHGLKLQQETDLTV